MTDRSSYWVTACVKDERDGVLFYSIRAEFVYDPDDYGNGTYLSLENNPFNLSGKASFPDEYLDIRYDTDYNPAYKPGYLVNWAMDKFTGRGCRLDAIGVGVAL